MEQEKFVYLFYIEVLLQKFREKYKGKNIF